MNAATPQVGTPERRASNRWWVPSGQVGYTVERMPDGRYRCTCPSFRWRRTSLPGGTCKHINAVKMRLAQERKVPTG